MRNQKKEISVKKITMKNQIKKISKIILNKIYYKKL